MVGCEMAQWMRTEAADWHGGRLVCGDGGGELGQEKDYHYPTSYDQLAKGVEEDHLHFPYVVEA